MSAYAALALSMTLVGSYIALTKPLTWVFPVFLLAWLRFGFAAIAMVPWLRKPVTEKPLHKKTHALIFLESFLGNFLFSIFMLFGISMTSAVSSGIIFASMPAVVALISWIFLRERLSVRLWSGIACTALGFVLLALEQPQTPFLYVDAPAHDSAWLGNILVFCAVLCEASYVVIGKSLTQVLSPQRISALINLWGLILSTPFGVWAALQFDFTDPGFSIWLLLLFYAMAASVATVWLWMRGLQYVVASHAGVFTVFIPISAVLIGVLFLGEGIVGVQILAFTLALLGILLATWKP